MRHRSKLQGKGKKIDRESKNRGIQINWEVETPGGEMGGDNPTELSPRKKENH